MDTQKHFIKKFSSKNILVVGDAMLDEYIFGKITRMSPEAPLVPLILIESKKYALGGAANVAHNITALGGNAMLLGVKGGDNHGRILHQLLKKARIKDLLITVNDRPTTTKIRIFENHRLLTRVDEEESRRLKKSILSAFISKIKHLKHTKIDFVIISDYAKGVISKKLFRALLTAFGGEKIIADFKPKHQTFIKNIYAISPNIKETSEIAKVPIKNYSDALKAAMIVTKKLGTSTVVTMGRYGVLVYDKNRKTGSYIPAKKVKMIDVTGAGDTLTAALALAVASGANLFEAAEFANSVAAISVSKLGTATVKPRELRNF